MKESSEITGTLTVKKISEQPSEYLDPKNDYAFKRLFGSKRFERLTIALLNDCLSRAGKERIDWIEFLPTTAEPDVDGKKKCVVDVLCHDFQGYIRMKTI